MPKNQQETHKIQAWSLINRKYLGQGVRVKRFRRPTRSQIRNRVHQEAVDETYPKLHEHLRPISQEDIDDALRSWNGDIASKRAVVRYMQDHARDKDTAAWLSREYGGSDSKSLFITRSGSPDSVELSWAKVQRRIAQLIKAEKFYTPEEYDRLDDIDGIAIRERLAERGIVNGEVVDPEALDRDPFIQRVMNDVEQIAAQEKSMNAPDRYSIRLHMNEGGITGIWDAALDRFYEEGNQVLRFAEQDNAIEYLANIQRTHGMEPTDPIFTTPTGKPYRVGEGISSWKSSTRKPPPSSPAWMRTMFGTPCQAFPNRTR